MTDAPTSIDDLTPAQRRWIEDLIAEGGEWNTRAIAKEVGVSDDDVLAVRAARRARRFAKSAPKPAPRRMVTETDKATIFAMAKSGKTTAEIVEATGFDDRTIWKHLRLLKVTASKGAARKKQKPAWGQPVASSRNRTPIGNCPDCGGDCAFERDGRGGIVRVELEVEEFLMRRPGSPTSERVVGRRLHRNVCLKRQLQAGRIKPNEVAGQHAEAAITVPAVPRDRRR